MNKTVIQIENIDVTALLEKFDELSRQINELKNNQTPPTPPKNELITRYELCKMLHITMVTASEWSKKGILKTYKIGNRIFYKRSEVENALEMQNRKPYNI